MPRSYLWLIPLSLVWPVLHLLVFAYRFGRVDQAILIESWLFLLMGLVSGIVLLFLLEKATSRTQKISILVGYLLLTPIGFVGSLLSGLMFPPAIGVILYGALPLSIGAALGYAAGRFWSR